MYASDLLSFIFGVAFGNLSAIITFPLTLIVVLKMAAIDVAAIMFGAIIYIFLPTIRTKLSFLSMMRYVTTACPFIMGILASFLYYYSYTDISVEARAVNMLLILLVMGIVSPIIGELIVRHCKKKTVREGEMSSGNR